MCDITNELLLVVIPGHSHLTSLVLSCSAQGWLVLTVVILPFILLYYDEFFFLHLLYSICFLFLASELM